MGDYDKLIEQTKATRYPKGVSGNPAHMRKARRELVNLARASVPRALERARQILDDDNAEWRSWMEAAKYITATAAIGNQPGPKDREADERPDMDPLSALTIDEMRALARQSLAELPAGDADDDADDDETH
jgi:hypothetical protein